ncbi:MAG TPA: F0F1 ATP synthase subunit B [Candidatus Saccharimonadales bacterium]|nr:F0F1 ATP synthase subunit B [Candidatus Saccharimonadales bacterium]
MLNINPQFAASSSGGISSLGINLKSFIFQLITFIIVLLILRRWVFPKLVATLEERRKTLEESLVQARATQEALEKAEEQSAEILHKAREQADSALADAAAQAKEVVAEAEAKAGEQAERVLAEARAQISQERDKLREELKGELADLVVLTTEKVLRTKLNAKEDARLIEQSIKELK